MKLHFFSLNRTLGTLYGNVNINQIKLANHIQALTINQQKLLRRDPSLMPSIARGAKIAIMQCQKQFRSRRWNCSAHHSESVFGKIIKTGKSFWSDFLYLALERKKARIHYSPCWGFL